MEQNGVQEVCNFLEEGLQSMISFIDIVQKDRIQEIRLRVNRPISVVIEGESLFLDSCGGIQKTPENLPVVFLAQMVSTLNKMCQYSLHTYLPQLQEGFLTITGGHRVGISANYLRGEGQRINFQEVTSMNIRIARDAIGCSEMLCHQLYDTSVQGTLIVGPPSSGKTTLLRDIARNLSSGRNGHYYKCAVIDSRGELGGMYKRQTYENMGVCTDIISGCSKGEGILQAIRVLSPDVILCDEAGNMEEVRAIEECLNAGVKVIITAHASCEEEMRRRPQIAQMLQTGAFSNYVILQGAKSPGKMERMGKVRLEYETARNGYAVILCGV